MVPVSRPRCLARHKSDCDKSSSSSPTLVPRVDVAALLLVGIAKVIVGSLRFDSHLRSPRDGQALNESV